MRGSIKALGGAAAFAIFSVASPATSQPSPTARLLPTRTDVKSPPPTPQLLSWFTFAGGSLEDKIPPPPNVAKRVVTLGPGGSLDDSKSFLKIDGRHNQTKAATVNRAGPEFNLDEFTVSLFYFIEYLYPGGATGSQMCSWQRILTHRTFAFEINGCAYPKAYVSGGPVHFDGIDALKPKVWTHVALTRTPTETKFYFRGALVGTAPSPPLPTDMSNGQLVYLGTSLYGAIDEFRFYKGVLDAAAISALAQAGPSIDKRPEVSVPVAPSIAK